MTEFREIEGRPFTTDDWATPRVIVDVLDALGGVALDPCSNPWSIVGAKRTYSLDRGEDGLVLPWTGPGEGLTYVNPPYSDPGAWMMKAAQGDGEVILLVNYDATKAWRDWGWPSDAVTFFFKRLKFIGDKKFQSAKPNAFIYWGDRPEAVAAATAALGKTWVRP